MQQITNLSSLDECVFMVSAINGVRCTSETLISNLEGHSWYADCPEGFMDKVKNLNQREVKELYEKLYKFWELYSIPDTEKRLKEVGLL
jgi:hypothetical protein